MGEPRPRGITVEHDVKDPRITWVRNAVSMLSGEYGSVSSKITGRNYLLRNILNRTQSPDDFKRPDFVNRDLLGVTIEGLGLQPEPVMAHWEASHSRLTWDTEEGREGLNKIYEQNVDAMLNLEFGRPGSVALLGNTFNIHCFNRYFPRYSPLMIDQFENAGDRSKPFGIYATPYDNATNNAASKLPMLEDLQARLGDAMHLRVFEFDGSHGDDGLVRTLFKAKSLYGPRGVDGHRASFGVLGTHSSGHTLDMSEKPGYSVSSADPLFQLEDNDAIDISRIRDVFTHDAVWILSGCNSGNGAGDNGIAYHLAHKFGITVVGSSGVATLKKVEIKRDKYGVDFDVEYTNGVRPVIYIPYRRNLI